ncbi:MAG TPA: type II toxin-antitoxin system RelE/ParE family toxin [Ignavibacteria bacterium]|nr:type II toxin-antitoxin system RelE/ParE family toxin [Ignavibacteria bacterium]
MVIHAEKTFLKDIDRIKDKTLLINLQKIISNLNDVNSVSEIPKLKKLSAKNNYYRIRIGDYRIGIVIINKEVSLIRFLHRKDIYKYFP